MSYVVGIDGGGTRTTVVVADAWGREVLRRTGPAGLVDPRAPVATVGVLVSVVRQAVREAGLAEPASALCAGLAGVGEPAEREVVRAALDASGIAARVRVACDGEIALEGAFGGGAGVLMIAGTGSIAWGRGEDGRMERCGGWGKVLGDEGSGYAIGRAGLTAALRAHDGRGARTRLLPRLLERLGLDDPHGMPSWAGRADKSAIAALAVEVVALAEEGDEPALEILRAAAADQAAHAAALVERLAPWTSEPPVVLFGGVFGARVFRDLVVLALADAIPGGFRVQQPTEDAVAGAVRMAAGLLGAAAG
jgi:glucosamine kinase